jgi:hypothetical protein
MRRVIALAVVLVAVAAHGDASTPRARPACHGREWQKLERALGEHCRAQPDAADHCRQLKAALAACEVDVDVLADGLRIRLALGGEWIGARFTRRAGRWVVVSLLGGDIP